MIALPEAIDTTNQPIPADLKEVLTAIKQRKRPPPFRNIESRAYMQWLSGAAMDMARRRIEFRKRPRKKQGNSSKIGTFIRQRRLELALTQQQLAEKYQLSIRVIRDLEQGKRSSSFDHVDSILKALGSRLSWK